MGSVYKASQPEMNRSVAIKILHPKLITRKDIVSRFRREARAMSHLTHPNTVRVFLYGELEDGALYIVMELLEGKNLNQVVRSEGPLAVDRAIRILIQASGALEEAHRAGILHRDLKPENIFVSNQGGIRDFAKVLDFGLAKVTERELRPGSVMLTQEGMVFGTPEFMSPEQAQGKKLAPSSDVYSLGMILYEAITGKLPFEAKGTMEFLQAHVSGTPIPLRKRAPEKVFPPLLERILDKTFLKIPEARFASAGEFALALEAVLEGKSEFANEARSSEDPSPSAYRGDTEPMRSVSPPPQSNPVRSSPPGTSPVGAVVVGRAPKSIRVTPPDPTSGTTDVAQSATIPANPTKSALQRGGPPQWLIALGFLLVGAILMFFGMRFLGGHR